jgi:hypothetical protein
MSQDTLEGNAQNPPGEGASDIEKTDPRGVNRA